MPRYPDDVLDSILQAVDLADVVGRYVPLKRSGKSWKGCCPFHQEKTPSFYVTPEKRMWKCFGCGKGGNAFTFLTEREGITFPEAVRQLAKEAGVALPEDDDPAAAEQASRLSRLRDVCEWACRFFQMSLRSPEGEAGREYFKRRGITGETARLFRLGYAPPGWQNLVDAARAEGLPEADLVDVGLIRRKDAEDGRPSRLFDMFRGRVTFPICDTQGRVIAFGARTLGDDEPKYLNSPESPLFSKGRTVYALHLAKQAMLRAPYEGAVMEGYTDVIMAHQCGWPVAVAGLGTALTRDQASMIARYVKKLHLVYDGDAAGQKAALRNAPVFLPEDIETRVAVLPPGEDPCDTLLRAGLPALRACVDKGLEAFDHLLAVQRATHDLSSVPGKAQALEAALEALVPVTDDVRRALYLTRVRDEYGVDDGVVRERFRELRAQAASSARRAPSPPPAPPPLAEQVAESSAPAVETPRAAPAQKPAGPPPAAEQWLIEALLGRPELCAEAAERLAADSVSHPLCRRLFDLLVGRWEETGETPRVDAVLGAIEDPQLASFAAGLVARTEGKDLVTQGRDCIARLATHHEARALSEGLDGIADPSKERRELNEEDGEMLRRMVEFHRRRAAGS